MRQPAKPKPSDVAETARVMRIFDWIADELVERESRGQLRTEPGSVGDVLIVAERIAARTSEDA